MPHSSPYSYKETSSPVEDDQDSRGLRAGRILLWSLWVMRKKESHYYPSIIACAECDFYCYMSGSASESVRLKVYLSFFILERCEKLLKIISWKLKFPLDI